MHNTFTLETNLHTRIHALRITTPRSLSEGLRDLELSSPLPTVVLSGHLHHTEAALHTQFATFFSEGIAQAAEKLGAVVIDSGVDSDIIRLMGSARKQIGAHFALLGVAAEGMISVSGEERSHRASLPFEPHHSHLVLVPGERLGDESPWIADIADVIAGSKPSLLIVVGGGEIAWEDIENSVASGRPILVLAGSGGTADIVAQALIDRKTSAGASRLPADGRFQIVRMADGPQALYEAILEGLSRRDAIPLAARPSKPQSSAQGDPNASLKELIYSLHLPESKKRFLVDRWLDQIQWMEGKAASCQRKYYWSRRILIVAAAFVPVLTTTSATFSAQGDSTHYAGEIMRWLSVGLSLLVAIAAAWEEFFRYGERWRHYRHTIEQLKTEGWLYLERSGKYAEYPSHNRAHSAFVLSVEQVLASDVERFVNQIAAERNKKEQQAREHEKTDEN